jgi:hypothetical protein
MQPSGLTVLALLLAGLFPACGSVGGYVNNRILDARDIIDFKYGESHGLGVKVEASMYAGLGAGGAAVPYCREWYGRRSLSTNYGTFCHFVLGGWDGPQRPFTGGENMTEWYQIGLPLNLSAIDNPDAPYMLERWRFGFELVFPGGLGGAYLNVGEVADFIAGIATIDMAADEDVSPGEQYTTHFEWRDEIAHNRAYAKD